MTGIWGVYQKTGDKGLNNEDVKGLLAIGFYFESDKKAETTNPTAPSNAANPEAGKEPVSSTTPTESSVTTAE